MASPARELKHVRNAIFCPALPGEFAVRLLAGHEFNVLAQPLPDPHQLQVVGVRARAYWNDMGAPLRQEDGQHAVGRIPSWRELSFIQCDAEGDDLLPVLASAEFDDGGGTRSW